MGNACQILSQGFDLRAQNPGIKYLPSRFLTWDWLRAFFLSITAQKNVEADWAVLSSFPWVSIPFNNGPIRLASILFMIFLKQGYKMLLYEGLVGLDIKARVKDVITKPGRGGGEVRVWGGRFQTSSYFYKSHSVLGKFPFPKKYFAVEFFWYRKKRIKAVFICNPVNEWALSGVCLCTEQVQSMWAKCIPFLFVGFQYVQQESIMFLKVVKYKQRPLRKPVCVFLLHR